MQEIELKARLTNPAATVATLEARGCVFSEPITQHDTIFVKEPSRDIDTYLENDYFLRIRVLSTGKTIFTAKYNPSRKHFGDTMVTEHEVEVASAEAARGIIELLGFKEAVQVSKSRRTGHLDSFEVCIDELEGIGSFIEVERCMPDDTELAVIEAAMHAFFAELGITEEDKQVKRYDLQMLERN